MQPLIGDLPNRTTISTGNSDLDNPVLVQRSPLPSHSYLISSR